MRPEPFARESSREVNTHDPPNKPESGRRWSSALVVAFTVFVVTYATFAANFAGWGEKLGWLPSSAVAAAFGWVGYCLPWIGEAIAFLWDLLSLLAMFF